MHRRNERNGSKHFHFLFSCVIIYSMVLLDGKKLSEKLIERLKQEIKNSKKELRLAIVVVGRDPVVEKFIAQKKKSAEAVGAGIKIYPFDEKITTNELRKRISEIVHEEKNTGVIIQLPLPAHINTQYILNAVTPEKDIDVLSSRALGNFIVGKNPIYPPVAGSIKALFGEYQIDYKNKQILVLGGGNLVGRPVALWLLSEKCSFQIISKESPDTEKYLRDADIIISGVGKPGFVRGDMIKDGAIVIDAGTSESGGKLVGDGDFESVAKKASYIAPVPGGVGPVTVAVLLQNLFILANK